ncbi:T9SS type A sorting domain-containing protein [Candidatus Amoebophilus asiaticus]|nr:T9SS type A sorting domain-containing protein [Candidatus Amoebophilus asiaticus]
MKRKYLWTLLIFISSSAYISVQAQSFCRNFNKEIPRYFSQNKLLADNSRSDTIDILDYKISLDITDFAGKTIDGNCVIRLTPKLNSINKLYFDLLTLTADSVKLNGSNLSFSHNDPLIVVNLASSLNIGDTVEITIYYQGVPQKDASGWGGFYFSGSYAFNLGVGFAANPHNYGRVWFPCFDNFVERSTYEFYITTDTTKKAACNGMLVDSTYNAGSTITWHWKMDQTIPTYLTCVAVGPYQTIKWTHSGINGTIPIELYASSGSVSNVKNSFANLKSCIEAFEINYGPHQFSKVGFSMVPFASGAMEHATNIAYPSSAANGSLTYETLMAHELSHHWWGDLSTCETAEDMWLNEGWAVYSEHIFHEYVYGTDKYRQTVRENHEYVLHYAHVNDNGYRAIQGVPHDYTYGTHVYSKGADVVHTLRSYMGDFLFFKCITDFLTDNSFKSMNSAMFRDYLSSCSGVDLTGFFDNWVFNPGFPHFSIDSITSSPFGNGEYYDVSVYIRQRLHEAPDYFVDVPLDIAFFDSSWTQVNKKVWMSNKCGIFNTSLTFDPVFVALDLNGNISDAITDEYNIINTTGTTNYDLEYFKLDVTSITDSALVRVEHNFVPPDRLKTPIPGLFLSDYRYWKIDGILPDNFNADAIFTFNGKLNTNGGYLDNTFITNKEDSLLMVYRNSTADDWSIWPSFTINNKGSGSDKSGEITVDDFKLGEYAMGIYDYDKIDSTINQLPDTCLYLSEKELPKKTSLPKEYIIYPNPNHDVLIIELLNDQIRIQKIIIHDGLGRIVLSEQVAGSGRKFEIYIHSLLSGTYYVSLESKDQILIPQKLILSH